MATPPYEVRREEADGIGRYVITLGPDAEAELVYHTADKGRIVINHTEVPAQFEGRGIAAQLVVAAVADARRDGVKITPLCSYVVAQFRRHPEWGDLLA